MASVAVYAVWRPRSVFDNVRIEHHELPIDDLASWLGQGENFYCCSSRSRAATIARTVSLKLLSPDTSFSSPTMTLTWEGVRCRFITAMIFSSVSLLTMMLPLFSSHTLLSSNSIAESAPAALGGD